MPIDYTLPVLSTPPNWSELLRERLEFRTDNIPAMDGSEQTRQTRMTPRRRFEFTLLAIERERQALANVAWARGARRFYLPLWTQGVRLQAAVPEESDALPVDTAGLEFAAGDVAVILGEGPGSYEVVELAAVESDHVQLVGLTSRTHPAGAWLHPVRRARFDAAVATAAFNRSTAQGRLRILVDEPNPYPSEAPATTYRGFPVLTTRPSYARDPETSLDRMAYRVDDDLGLVNDHDDVGLPLYRQVHDWNLVGHAELHAWRAMVYALQGKRGSLWVPTWLDDLTPAAGMTAGAKTMVVAWCGYAAHVAQAMNRRDLRIELASGAVLYRRVMNSVDNGNGTETITLDNPLGVAATVAQFAQVSFMGLCRSDSDQYEIGWWRADYADVTTAWRARIHDA